MRLVGFIRTGTFSAAVLLGFAAQAATLNINQGGVLVSRGGAPYQLATRSLELKAGDSVIANPGGSASVIFQSGCAVPVEPGMVFTVPSAPPCVAEGPTMAATESGNYTILAVGAAVVAGGVGIAIAAGGGGGGGGGGGYGGGSP